MSLGTILLIVLVIILLGGFSGIGGGPSSVATMPKASVDCAITLALGIPCSFAVIGVLRLLGL
jgi:hypothetical protein